MNSRKAAVAVFGTAALLLTAVPAAGQGQAPYIAPHRHFLVTPAGTMPVGPQVCDDPGLQTAFNQFHAAVHVGPANDAFDHSHNPVDIQAGRC